MTQHSADIDQLVTLLRRLYRAGIHHPAYLLHSPHADETIRLITGHAQPARDDYARLQQLTAAHTIITAAAAALGEPETTVVRHLLDLQPDATRVRGGIERRRGAAARAYSADPAQPVSGPSFLRRTEKIITYALAAEIIRRIHPQPAPQGPTSGEQTIPSPHEAPPTPPPPIAAFRPTTPQPRRATTTTAPNLRRGGEGAGTFEAVSP